MNRLRWRLARRIAPVPIMADPFPGDGAFVVQRTNGLIASFRAETLEVHLEHRLIDGDTTSPQFFTPIRVGTFSGNLA